MANVKVLTHGTKERSLKKNTHVKYDRYVTTIQKVMANGKVFFCGKSDLDI